MRLIAGAATEGMMDGPGHMAQFNNLSGSAVSRDSIVVCDQGNDRIRLINKTHDNHTVTTVIGPEESLQSVYLPIPGLRQMTWDMSTAEQETRLYITSSNALYTLSLRCKTPTLSPPPALRAPTNLLVIGVSFVDTEERLNSVLRYNVCGLSLHGIAASPPECSS